LSVAINKQQKIALRFIVIFIVNSRQRVIGLSRFASHNFLTPTNLAIHATRVFTKNQSQLLLLVSQRHQTADKRYDFWQKFKKQLQVWLWLCLPPDLCNAHTS